MKLLRFGPRGAEKPGLLDTTGTIRDLSALVDDITPALMTADDWTRLRAAAADAGSLPAVAAADAARLGPPVAGVGNILCIGLNYRDHAAETGSPEPTEPIVFNKHTSALSGPDDPLPLPRGSLRTDWEAELGIVIGKPCNGARERDALDHVAGFCVGNDVSERTYQFDRGGQWIKGKSCPGFCPLGPWLVTPDEIDDPQDLGVWLEVNGERMQDGSTRDMVFGVAHLISYLSRFFTLMPGDVILTGTPAGTGMGHKRYLKQGDEMRLGIDGLGEQRQKVVENAFAAV
ncbi:2-hydroxyhepta-2,4-diene-1,7-dioate isomerase [Caenispirillum salinarum AK4]|uniref:2-hydroxyhepta-2,4-diene-1,7-dioate isomerase n=1 Tax=Caenispirillum salinarum AK4 TaxID=1238182 RepID=K9GNJ6_9PROT|nr:fumarylacetoacetate hydrolase family protein [Caenispirillum salinarum]EKV27540.1 2-hydroxyhepta-2,4-diene-1,7-dioate isomerase [Caenispirillum salinarum AK4]